MYEKLRALYAPYGEFDYRTLESLKIALGNKFMDTESIDYDTMVCTLSLSNAVEYFESNLKPTEKGDPRCYYIWVSTGLPDSITGNTIYLAFVKNKKDIFSQNTFWCYYVSTYDKLEQNIINHMAKTGKKLYEPVLTESAVSDNEYYTMDDFDKKILVTMGKNVNEVSAEELNILCQYLYAVDRKIKYELTNDNQKNYVTNKEKNHICYKIKMHDFRGRDILVYQKLIGNALYERDVIKSKEQLVKLGFDSDVMDIAPVSFHTDIRDLIAMPAFDDFDLDNLTTINHIFKERAERFPEDISDMNMEDCYSMLEDNIKYNAAKCQRDYKWAVPFYAIKKDKIQHLLPFYMGRKRSGRADLALVVAKETYYVPVTVLTIDVAYKMAAVLSEPIAEWIRKEPNN